MDKDELKFSSGVSSQLVNDPLPLRILVIGNFSGCALPASKNTPCDQQPDMPAIAPPSLRSVEPHNLESFFASLNVNACIEVADFFTDDCPESYIRFKPHNIHDFTPAGLLEAVPEFRALKNAQASMRELVAGTIDEQQVLAILDSYRHINSLRMLKQDIQDLITREPDQHGARHISNRFKCVSQAMDYIVDTEVSKFLQHREVQALEALWRGLRFLIERSDFQQQIQIDCLNTPGDQLLESFDHYVIEQQRNSSAPYSVILSTFYLDNSSEQLDALQKLAEYAEMLQTPLLFTLSHDFFGVDAEHILEEKPQPISLLQQTQYQQWKQLRSNSSARWLVALYNRFLLRNQYEPDMRNAAGITEHVNKPSQRLWGNPVFGLASLLTRSFEYTGWPNNIHGPEHGKIGDLPLFAHLNENFVETFLPLEATLNLQQAEDFSTQGITTLSCSPDEDCAYIYYVPCVFDSSSARSERYLQLSGATNNLPYQMLFSAFSHQVQRNYERLSQIPDPAGLEASITNVLHNLVNSTGEGARLGVSVSITDDDSGRHIISIRAISGDQILAGAEVEFGIMV